MKISGFWTAVTIQPPQPPDQRLWLSAEHTWQLIQDHSADLDEQAVQTWLAHLQSIAVSRDLPVDRMDIIPEAVDMYDQQVNGRPRLGLLNLIRHISRTLFGTAMHSAIKPLQQVVEDTPRQTGVLYHISRSMLSVMNQRQYFVNENCDDIKALQIEMHYSFNTVADCSCNLTVIVKWVQMLELPRMIDWLIGTGNYR